MIKLIAVDLQFEFTRPFGRHYRAERRSVQFIKTVMIPWLRTNNVTISQIISDYRQPRPGDEDESCVPGTLGFESEIPAGITALTWVKAMNSPLYTRQGAGNSKIQAKAPYADPDRFYKWLEQVGFAYDTRKGFSYILFGLTLDCCVLCTAAAIRMAGYDVKIILDATDTYRGGLTSKRAVFDEVVKNWAEPISWSEVKEELIEYANLRRT